MNFNDNRDAKRYFLVSVTARKNLDLNLDKKTSQKYVMRCVIW